VDEIGDKVKTLRRFLGGLKSEAAGAVACRSAWKLLFNEEITL